MRRLEVKHRTDEKLKMNCNYALLTYLNELKKNQINVKMEGNRLNFIHKDKKWLIKLCHQLKEELAIKKDKVKYAERIMNDLKSLGQESIETLVAALGSNEGKYFPILST